MSKSADLLCYISNHLSKILQLLDQCLECLGAQVDPAITPEHFWSLAMQTGHTIELDHNGAIIPLGPIIDRVALIGALQSK